MTRKSISLLELILAISLMGVIILGVTSFDMASRQFFTAAERKAKITNEAALILDRIAKDALSSIGHGISESDSPAAVCPYSSTHLLYMVQDTDKNGIRDDNFDELIVYAFDNNSHVLSRTQAGGDAETVSDKVIIFGAPVVNNTIKIYLTLRYDPSKPADPISNPQVQSITTVEVPAWSLN